MTLEASATLILAAGASTRFGGHPKALLRLGSESAIERITRIAREAGFSPVVAVVGRHAVEIRSSLSLAKNRPDEIVENAEWAAGRTGSVQAGLAATDPGASILLWPVDCPLGSAATLETLVDRFRADALGLWFVPTYEGRGGHPVLFRPEVRPRVLALARDAPLRALLPELGPQVVRVPVSDPGVTANLNTPEQYEQMVRTRSEWEEPWTGR
ncbi:MAG: nucleotidyltransferase family protein [Thermoplasmata archaeon]|nr:nucleotidyltransferase family protein [Thermoplasmata archaeon]